jgi:hypothetical protein
MSLANLDDISPKYIGEAKFTLTPGTERPTAGVPVVVDIDYGTDARGVELPLECIVQGSADESYVRQTFELFVPPSVVFTPIEGGRHVVMVRELGHNRWWGRLEVDVAGELLESVA